MKKNTSDHQIEFTEHGLAFCTRCKGGEVELEESCLSRLRKRYEAHPLYKRAVIHARLVLQRPADQLKADLVEKALWPHEIIPTAEELAPLIIMWKERKNAEASGK
jgi:hypothetical protein